MNRVPDTRVPCGIHACASLKEPWRLGCDTHMAMLPPGIMRLITSESVSTLSSNSREKAIEQARRIWNGEMLEPRMPLPMSMQPLAFRGGAIL